MTTTAGLHRLPEEMQLRAQWALAGASKAPLSVDANGKLYLTAVTRPGEWLTFEQVVYYSHLFKDLVTTHVDRKDRTITQTGLNGGFILNEADEFCAIDLDVKDAETHPDEPELWTKPEQFDLYWSIVQSFQSYTERSRSGKGLHVWARGKIGPGFRRDGIEVYSQERFIICTGDVVIDGSTVDRQTILTNMVSRMRPVAKDFELTEFEPDEDDWSVLLTASVAGNSDKFLQLRRGEWRDMGFPSQSEADLALMSMFAFYSKSNEQCRRLFRDSALGKREKAVKDDRYLNFTLRTIRERQWREERADISAIIQSAELVQQQAAASRAVIALQAPASEQPTQAATAAPVPALPEVAAASFAPVGKSVTAVEGVGIPWPPGFVGTVAKYIYQSAPRPVKEVAIVGALGLLAGIVGKAWCIPQSGLNLYIVLIGKSGIGKEAMHSGISNIIRACQKDFVMFSKFIDFTDYVSGPALIKACVVNPCFVNVSGEWGKKMERLSQDTRDTALQTLRTQMTNLYQKSGPAAIVGGIGYSSTDNNVASIAGVSYSMIGETTPGTFYKTLNESMMEDGFMSRFLLFEYNGPRVHENEFQLIAPDAAMVRALNNIAMQADALINKEQTVMIGRTEEAAAIMKAFDLECDDRINETQDESKRQMWNRAALKAARVAGVLAVANNHHAPVITAEDIHWAHERVREGIALMQKRLDSGDVGNDDGSRERKVVSMLHEFMSKPVPASYKVPEGMHQAGIVPHSYLQMRTSRTPTFLNHKNGASRALTEVIQSLIHSGYLVEPPKDKIFDAYSFHGKCYRIIKLPDYSAQTDI